MGSSGIIDLEEWNANRDPLQLDLIYPNPRPLILPHPHKLCPPVQFPLPHPRPYLFYLPQDLRRPQILVLLRRFLGPGPDSLISGPPRWSLPGLIHENTLALRLHKLCPRKPQHALLHLRSPPAHALPMPAFVGQAFLMMHPQQHWLTVFRFSFFWGSSRFQRKVNKNT